MLPELDPELLEIAASREAADAVARALPFRVPLSAQFRSMRFREGLLIEGPQGWGEFSPFQDYDTKRSALWLLAALESAFFAWPEPVRGEVPSNAILPEVDVPTTARLAAAAVQESGCRTIKVKVANKGEGLADDLARVGAIRKVLDDLLGSGVGRIRIDANGRWDADEARRALEQLARLGIEYVEQPCRSADEMRVVKAEGVCAVAADEAIRIDAEIDSVAEFADVAILKVAPLGGIRRTLALAEGIPLPIVISGSMDTSIGLSASVAAAAALPDLPLDCGLGTGALLAADVTRTTVLPSQGVVAVGRPEVLVDDSLVLTGTAADAAADRLQAVFRDQLRELS